MDDRALTAIGLYLHALETLKLKHCDRISTAGIERVSRGCHVIETLDLTGISTRAHKVYLVDFLENQVFASAFCHNQILLYTHM
jgi:hypothetical protein